MMPPAPGKPMIPKAKPAAPAQRISPGVYRGAGGQTFRPQGGVMPGQQQPRPAAPPRAGVQPSPASPPAWNPMGPATTLNNSGDWMQHIHDYMSKMGQPIGQPMNQIPDGAKGIIPPTSPDNTRPEWWNNDQGFSPYGHLLNGGMDWQRQIRPAMQQLGQATGAAEQAMIPRMA